MKKLTLLFAAVATLVSWNLSAVAPTDFKMKLPITVNAEAVGEKSATDLPVLVRLSESIEGFKYSDLAADGSDLAFGVDDGETITFYPHEIDTWNPTGESLVWVKVPTVAAGTTFNAYYGNGASGGAMASATWSNYTGVWHLNEAGTDGGTTALKIANATANGSAIDGEAFGGTTGASGRIGGARRISDASTNSGKAEGEKKGGVWVPGDQDCTKFDGVFTISAWFYHKNQNYYWDHMFHKKTASNASEGGLAVEVNSGGPGVDIYGGNSTKLNAALGMQKEVWQYVTLVFSDTTCTVYKDGAYVNKKTNIGKATDSTKRWVFGNDVDGYGGVDGDISWKGLIDEARLSGTAFTDDYVALEYAAMATDSFLSFGTPEIQDATMPSFSSMSVKANATAGFDVSVTLADGSGTLKAVLVDVEDEQSSFEADFNGGAVVSELGTYTATVTGMAAGHTYACWVRGTSTGLSPLSRFVDNVYNGEIKIEKLNDADETDMSSGFFKVSLVDGTDAVGADITVAYRIGGTAVAGETYEAIEESVVIPAGESEALIEIKPIYSASVVEDVNVTLTLDPGPYQIGESAEATVVIKNSQVNPYVRYVSMTGNDGNNGLTIGSAMATLQAAVDSLDEFSTDNDCTVFVADGTYEQPKNVANYYSVYVTKRVSIIGMSSDASKVTITRASDAKAIFDLENEHAALRHLTVKGGTLHDKNTDGVQKGGGVYLVNGVVEDCVVTDCVGPAYGQSGVGIFVEAGRVSRCEIRNCTSNNDEANGTGICLDGGLVEDTLVTGCSCKNGGAIKLSGSAKAINCTVVKNTGTSVAGIRVDSDNAKAVNCAIFGNTVTESMTRAVYTETRASCYVNCAADIEIVGGVSCLHCQPVFKDWANGDFRPVAGSQLLNAGASRTEYGANSETDLDGRARIVGTVDIGCYENQSDAVELGLWWSADKRTLPTTVTLLAGSNGIASPTYEWTLHNETTGADKVAEGQSLALDFGDADAGTYTVSVTAGGLTYTSNDKLQLSLSSLYVDAASSAPAFPFGSETPAATVQAAIDVAVDGATIFVAPGTYPISAQMTVSKALRILGAGRKYTDVVITNTVKSANHRIFVLQHTDAFVANLTMAGGYTSGGGNGGNLFITACGGSVSNCLLTAGSTDASYQQGSAAAYLSGGLLTHCEITRCNSMPKEGQPCTRILTVSNARASNCLIHDCDYRVDYVYYTENGTRSGGNLITVAANGILDGCTIADVVNADSAAIIYVYAMQGGFAKGSKVVNCAIFGSDQNGVALNPMLGNTAWQTPPTVCFKNCVTERSIEVTYATKTQNMEGTYTADESNVMDATRSACFVDYDNADYRVKDETSPLFGAAGVFAEVSQIARVDLAGKPRVTKGVMDVGCYEFQPKVGLRLILR